MTLPDPDRIDRAKLFIAAAPPRVFGAWLDPDILVQWLPPRGMTGRVESFDPRPGGAFHIVLTHTGDVHPEAKTDSRNDEVRGRFVTVEPNSRLVIEVDFTSDKPEFHGTMEMDWSFAPDRMGTTVRIHASNVPRGIAPKDHEKGMTSSLENLALYLTREDE